MDSTDKVTEKVYCYGHPSSYQSSSALETAALMNGGIGGNQMWNNPMMYLVWMWMMRWMNGNGHGFGNEANAEGLNFNSRALSQLQSTVDNNHNNDLVMQAIHGNAGAVHELAQTLNTDFNTMSQAVCSVKNAVEQVSGQVGYSAERVINAANLGDLNIVQQLKDCCCTTQQNIVKMGYENQLGQKDIQNAMQQGFSYTNTGLERGFSNIGFQMSQMACDLKTNENTNTQRIIDTLNNHWQEDLQLRLNRAELELSQQRQNATLIAALKTTSTTATT